MSLRRRIEKLHSERGHSPVNVTEYALARSRLEARARVGLKNVVFAAGEPDAILTSELKKFCKSSEDLLERFPESSAEEDNEAIRVFEGSHRFVEPLHLEDEILRRFSKLAVLDASAERMPSLAERIGKHLLNKGLLPV